MIEWLKAIMIVESWMENDLITRAQTSDVAAYTRLFRAEERQLIRIAATILGDEERAADVVQDAYVQGYSQIGRFRAESSIGTWLTAIVVNLCRAKLRREKIIRFVALDWLRGHNDGSDVERTIGKRIQRKTLWHDVQKLKPTHRLPVVLHYYGHYSCEEVADILGITVSTVYARLRTARKILRDEQTRRTL